MARVMSRAAMPTLPPSLSGQCRRFRPSPLPRLRRTTPLHTPQLPACLASAGGGGGVGGTRDEDFFAAYGSRVRAAPVFLGGAAISALILNRLAAGIAPVADASSGQSRADVLVVALSATLILTGLVWITVQPRIPVTVELEGEPVSYVDASLPASIADELLWAWEAARAAVPASSLAVLWDGRLLLHQGLAAPGPVLASWEALGPICRDVIATQRGNYFANLTLFPGRREFTYLPANTQAVLVQSVGERGVLIAACATSRGFSTVDQAWLASICDKIDSTLEAAALPSSV